MAEGSQPLFTNYRTGKQLTIVEGIGTASISNDQLAGPIGALIGTASITNENIAGPIVAIIGTASINNSQLAGPIVDIIGTASITQNQIQGGGGFSQILIASGFVTASANISITLTTSYDEVELRVWNVISTTDGDELGIRFSQGGVFLSNSVDYAWGYQGGPSTFTDTAESYIQMFINASNVAGELGWVTVKLLKSTTSSFTRSIVYYGGYIAVNSVHTPIIGQGELRLNQDAIDGIRVLFIAGSITGYYSAIGIIYA